MTPETQAVFQAFVANWHRQALLQDRLCLAAALRALADQVAPESFSSFTGHVEWDQGLEASNDSIRDAILDIAAGLENANV